MRKILFLVLFLPVTIFAQTAEFGFFSMEEVMNALPEYATAQDEYNALLERCDSEVARSEEELTRCYVAFLEGQSSFPEPILRKRQKELQDLVDRSVMLRDQLKEWLSQAHDSLFAPIENKIDEAVERVCLRNNYAYAIDCDKRVYRFVNPNIGVKITDLVIQEVISPKPVVLQPVAPETAPATPADTTAVVRETLPTEVPVVEEKSDTVKTATIEIE